MKKEERLRKIERLVAEQNYVSVEDLCKAFSVHINTIRSDINELVQMGLVEKAYGGVRSKKEKLPTSFDERQIVNPDSKRIIGELAAQFLEEDDVVYLDSGTTVQMLLHAPNLPKRLTIITNSLPVINCLVSHPEYNVFVLPGNLRGDLNNFVSLETIDSIQTYRIQKAFMGVRGISENGDLLSASHIDVKLKKTVFEISSTIILMADSEKINHPGILHYANLRDCHYWVADMDNERIKQMVIESNVKLITPANT